MTIFIIRLSLVRINYNKQLERFDLRICNIYVEYNKFVVRPNLEKKIYHLT